MSLKVSRILLVVFSLGLVTYTIFSIFLQVQPPTSPLHHVVVGNHVLNITDPSFKANDTVKDGSKEDKLLKQWKLETGKSISYQYDELKYNSLKDSDRIRIGIFLSRFSKGVRSIDFEYYQNLGTIDTRYSWDFYKDFNITYIDESNNVKVKRLGTDYVLPQNEWPNRLNEATKENNTSDIWMDNKVGGWTGVLGRMLERSFTTVQSVKQMFARKKPQAERNIHFKLRPMLWRNAPLYLHVVTMDRDQDILYSQPVHVRLDKLLQPASLKHARRYLLSDPSGSKLDDQLRKLQLDVGQSILSVPTKIEIGPVIEFTPMYARGLHQMLASNDALLNHPRTDRYTTPTYVNLFAAPRDLYVPLLSLEDLPRPASVPYDPNRINSGAARCNFDRQNIFMHPYGYSPLTELVSDDELEALGVLETWKVQRRKKEGTATELSEAQKATDEHIEYTMLSEDWKDIRDVEFVIEFKPISFSYWYLYQMLEESFVTIEEQFGMRSYDVDSLRIMVSGTSAWLLGIFYFISGLHLVFQTLALFSDIGFWRSQESYDGISVNSLILNLVLDFIVILYLRDSGDSYLVQIFIVARAVLLIWKILKLVKLVPISRFPFVTLARKYTDSKLSPQQLQLEIEEAKWTQLLFSALVPFIVGVAVYQLYYLPQKGWYSWVIHSIAVCAYAGGFVTMTPQLYRNYALKSVDHLPWRSLFYQFVNTFIDDAFSLVIRMPQMHRVSVLRDDVVFVIYMYQRWIYRNRCDTVKAEDVASEQQHEEKKRN